MSTQFDNITADLSGGLDTRLIYAALTNIPSSRERVGIHAKRIQPDLTIATRINGIYGYKYDDAARSRAYISREEADQLGRSFHLGTYFSHNLIQSLDEHHLENVGLNGACGEILARPYFSRNLFGTGCDEAETIEEFCDELIRHLSPSCIGGTSLGLENFRKALSEELALLPSSSPYEALDRMYLNYRHGYHFDGGISCRANGFYWSPLQNKTLFALHHRSYRQLRGLEIQGLLMFVLNPLLASMPFADDRDNRDMALLQRAFKEADPRYWKIGVDQVASESSWEEAERRRIERIRYLNARPADWNVDSKEHLDQVEGTIRELSIREPAVFGSDLVAAVRLYVSNNRVNSSRVRQTYNKLVSVLDQIEIISGQ